MEISESKSNKYVAFVTYLIAVVCLLLGLFLPLFAGSDILALKLPQVVTNLYTLDNSYDLSNMSLVYLIDLGTGKYINFMGIILLCYTVITVLSLLALIPIGISLKNGSKTSFLIEFIIEVAAVIILGVYVIIALQFTGNNPVVSYNIITALGGTLLMLIILSFVAGKKSSSFVKLILFLLSSAAVLALFDLTLIIPGLSQSLSGISGKINPALFGDGTNNAAPITYLNLLFSSYEIPGSDGSKVLYTFGDAFKLMPDAKNKTLMLLCAITSLIVIINFIFDVGGLAARGRRAGLGFNLVRYCLELAAIISLLATVLISKYTIGLMLIILIAVAVIQVLISILRFLLCKKTVKVRKHADEPDQIIFVKPEHHHKAPVHSAKPVKEAVVNKTPEPQPKPAAKPVEPLQMGITKLHPVEIEPVEAEKTAVADDEEIIQVKDNGHVQMEITEQPEEVKPEPAPAPVKPLTPIKPITPVAPVTPVTATEPVHETPAPAPVQKLTPLREVKPLHEPVREVKPVQPVNTQPAPEPRIYTFNTIYGGPVDEFIKKLTNDERIEFAMTFIEKSKGNIGNIPEYVVGGNNKKFFSSVFIYLGRIRGMISDGLLNKMYKELNMF